MNATTKNLTLAALLALTATTASAEFGDIRMGQPGGYGYDQGYSSRSRIVNTYPTGRDSSRTTVIGDPRGFQMYNDNGSVIQRIGSGDGPRTWLRSGNVIHQLGE